MTKVVRIGVPLELASVDMDNLRIRLVNSYLNNEGSLPYNGKIIKVAMRLPKEVAGGLMDKAKENGNTFTGYTCNLLWTGAGYV